MKESELKGCIVFAGLFAVSIAISEILGGWWAVLFIGGVAVVIGLICRVE